MNTKNYKNKILLILSIPLILLVIGIGTSLGSSNISVLDTFSILGNKFFNVPLTNGIDPKQVTMPIVGFLCSLITMVIVLKFSEKVDRGMSNTTIILAGMVISLFFSAALTTISALASDKIQSITMWSMGSFSMKGWSYVKACIPFFIIGILGVSFYFKEMDVLTFGEDQAKTIGVDTNKVKRRLFLYVAILTGSAIALSGTIGFVDLIAPHVVRKIFGSKHSYVVPMSAVFGGCMMILTDLVARTIVAPSELPVGAITALIGAPFFAYIYFKKSK